MTSVNFGELLGVQVDSVERPKSFPVGHYEAVILGHELGQSSKKETPYARFNVKLISPLEDVDPELFEEAGGLEGLNARKPLYNTFYLTPDAIYRLREFLENALELSCHGRAFDEVLPEATNCSVVAVIEHQTGDREGEVYMQIRECVKGE